MIRCLKCDLFGIGESTAVDQRIHSYLTPIQSGRVPTSRGAILAHFAEPGHQAEHFAWCILDGIPLSTPLSLRGTLRRYLESAWIERAGAQLNQRRNLFVSFGGGSDRKRKRDDASGSED